MKNAVIYARFSCDKQNEQSIEGQLTVCYQYANNNDIKVVGEYIDRATTGTNDHRPAFQEMLADSASGGWDYVIVYKFDRFSRDRFRSAVNKKVLKDNGVKLLSATENIPDSPEGIILESLLEGMAEYYSAELSQKVKRGMNETKKKGLFTGGQVRYGYTIINQKPVIDPAEAAVVTLICEEYAKRKTAREICSSLQERDRHGKRFALSKIYAIVAQQAQGGDQLYPPIVNEALRGILASIIEDNKHAPASRKSFTQYLLTGKLFCGECGKPMIGSSGTSKTGAVYYYYKCKGKHTKIRKDKIEGIVADACREVLNSGYMEAVIDKAYAYHTEDMSSAPIIANLEAKLKEHEKALSNIMSAIEQGIFTAQTKKRIEEVEAAIATIQNRISEEKNKSPVSKEDLRDFLSQFIGRQEFDQDIIDTLVRNVLVFKDKVRITFNYSPKRTVPITEEELVEAKCSSTAPQGSPRATNTNTMCFFYIDFWGIWCQKSYP
jgi:DNA invertase Pin-like site-specific DNA recombinase